MSGGAWAAGRWGRFRLVGGVQGGNAPEVGRAILGFGKIIVAVQADGHANFGVGRLVLGWSGRGNCGLDLDRGCGHPAVVRGFDDPQDAAPATDAHAFAEGDFAGHLQRKLNFRTFVERHVGEQKSSAGTEVLSETQSFGGGRNVAQGDGKIKSKALSDAAFNTNRGSSHGRVTSFGNRQGKAHLQP